MPNCPTGNLAYTAATNTFSCVAGAATGFGYISLNPLSARLPATNPAIIDNTTARPQIIFDNVVSQCVNWSTVLPDDYAGTPTVRLVYRAARQHGERLLGRRGHDVYGCDGRLHHG